MIASWSVSCARDAGADKTRAMISIARTLTARQGYQRCDRKSKLRNPLLHEGTVKLEIDPQILTPEQRGFVADQMYEGVRFPKDAAFYIVPPTIEGFLAAVNYGIAVGKEGLLGSSQALGFGQAAALEMIRFSAVKAFVTHPHITMAIDAVRTEVRTAAIAKSIGQIKLGGS
jgi:hypothetical protein